MYAHEHKDSLIEQLTLLFYALLVIGSGLLVIGIAVLQAQDLATSL